MNRPNTSMASGVQMHVRPRLWRKGIEISIGCFCGYVIGIALFWILFGVLGPPFSDIDVMQIFQRRETVLFLCVFWVLITMTSSLIGRRNILLVTENYIKGPGIFKPFRPRTLPLRSVRVSASSVDVLKSSHRPVISKLLGQYRIYNEDGTGLRVDRYTFSRADFKKIKERVNDVLGVDLDRT